MARVLFVVALLLAASACTSPEASRARAGGPGADVGNRRDVVDMHEGARPFHRTPRFLANGRQAPIDTARDAERLSLR